ncbi:hypothetical protein JWS13_12810 [Rhodococcus pseudokoreensis]|uniref:Uncharacterized protein n=1 Tax=Rhodococcus pseudokoreensis TaxID=2811421 RepID=A0A974ZT45_9NOCA|nr:hypothetical protein [Rhodococcus pseudokoreensis]QSE89440.1 hypothetical protein JWS13_12810 [Rhodococcus pseudokoreensis]
MIARRLHEPDVPMLESGCHGKYDLDRDWLYQCYVVDKRTHGRIAAEAGVSQSAIERLTVAYGIPNRS